ncbi:MAG: SpoIIE family protein phosphatase [Myxococcota bacterium]|nr:SpoIIE family protein phosphatase [Myxococcota bacterium]
MGHSITFRRSLFRNLAGSLIILVVPFLGIAAFHIERTEERLAAELTDRAVSDTHAIIQRFFEPIGELVLMGARYFSSAGADPSDPEALDRYFMSLLATVKPLSGATVGLEDGRSYTLNRTATGWMRLLSDPSQHPERVLVSRWTDAEPEIRTEWEDGGYDARTRPWFAGALAGRPAAGGRSASPSEAPHWTHPYEFSAHNTGQPGVTASAAFEAPDGSTGVITIDVLLRDISTFTMGLRLAQSGSVAVLYGEEDGPELAVVGLPAGLVATREEALERYLMAPASAVGGALVDYLDAMAGDASDSRLKPRSFQSGDDRWWGAAARYGNPAGVLIVAIVPQNELVGAVEGLAAGVLAAMVLMAVFAVWRISRVSHQYASSIEDLVGQTERMAGLNFEQGGEVDTPIEEIQMLAQAQEQLRGSLEAISSRREDLLIARAMRAEAKLVSASVPAGFQLGVLDQCSEAVGGSVFDAAARPGSETRLCLLLAVVPGEGIAASCEAERVQSAFQAGVRLDATLEEQARQIGTHVARRPELRAFALCVAELDGADSSLAVLTEPGCPVVHFSAAAETFTWVPAGPAPVRIALEHGDSVLLATESVLRALSPERACFGREGLEAAVRRHRDADAETLARGIGAALDAFTDAPHAERDRTLLVFRRVSAEGG